LILISVSEKPAASIFNVLNGITSKKTIMVIVIAMRKSDQLLDKFKTFEYKPSKNYHVVLIEC
jgi:hypothetical protein